ncbi:MAG: 1-acyl-sn-glycerol-3-phosphate acyltransferase [Planctomycetes bacterium]|nr:1-acyl-sn-glycerol-3-phosphate acyltransferase [Planctomycetota bacterium]
MSKHTPENRPWRFTWKLRLVEWGMRLANYHILRGVHGLENVPMEGGYITVANHLSFGDGIMLAQILDNRRREATHFISYSELFDIPFVGMILRIGEGIVLDRSNKDGIELALKEAERLITEEKHGVALFPEAHMGKPEKMRQGRPGAALLAMRTGAPVLPAGLVGFERIARMDRKGRLRLHLKRRQGEVFIGRAMDLSPWREVYFAADKKVQEAILSGLTTLMMRVVASLSGQHYPFKEADLLRAVELLDNPPAWVSNWI